ncbi:MAG: phage holin family protein [Paludibacteraceae bacterium]|nr:phage holin family protein [Paludibacteraceae bacterium]
MEKQFDKILNDCLEYLRIRFDLLKLDTTDKLARILGTLVFIIVAVLLGFAALVFFAVAATVLLSQCMPLWAACCVFALVFLIILAVVVYLKKELFINSFIQMLYNMFFEENNKELEQDVLPNDRREERL